MAGIGKLPKESPRIVRLTSRIFLDSSTNADVRSAIS